MFLWRKWALLKGRRAIDVAGALAEGVHHALGRLVEHHADRGLQDPAAEFEVDEEGNLGAADVRREIPLVVEVAEGPAFVFDVDPPGPVEGDAAGEALAK